MLSMQHYLNYQQMNKFIVVRPFFYEVYEEALNETLNNFSLIDEGDIGSLDMFTFSDFIGRVESVKAAIGNGGGMERLCDDEGNLVMTPKVSDTAQDLSEIYDAYLLWTKIKVDLY